MQWLRTFYVCIFLKSEKKKTIKCKKPQSVSASLFVFLIFIGNIKVMSFRHAFISRNVVKQRMLGSSNENDSLEFYLAICSNIQMYSGQLVRSSTRISASLSSYELWVWLVMISRISHNYYQNLCKNNIFTYISWIRR